MVTKCYSIWIFKIIHCESSFHINAGHESIVRLLIQNKANINIVNENGNTPLYYAVQLGEWRVLEWMPEILFERFEWTEIIRYFQIDITSLKLFLRMTQIKISGILLARPQKILLQKEVIAVL